METRDESLKRRAVDVEYCGFCRVCAHVVLGAAVAAAGANGRRIERDGRGLGPLPMLYKMRNGEVVSGTGCGYF